MANNNNNNDTGENSKEASKKRSNGRRKIPIETIKDSTKKHVTFSKRRVGLFKKASELCALCGVEMTILTFSERGKLFCFGHPNPDAVIHRYLRNGTHDLSNPDEDRSDNELALMVEEHNRQYEDTKRKIAEERRFADYCILGKTEQKNKENGAFWWDEARVDEMGLDELEEYMGCLVELRNNIANRVDQLTGTTTLPFMSSQMEMGNIFVDQNTNCHNKGNNFGYAPQGLQDTNIAVSQSFNFRLMNEVRAISDLRIEDDKELAHFSNVSSNMEFLNVAVMNHQVSVMEDHGSTSYNPDVGPRQAFKFETRHF